MLNPSVHTFQRPSKGAPSSDSAGGRHSRIRPYAEESRPSYIKMLVVNTRDALSGGKGTNDAAPKSNGSMHEPFVFVPITQSEAAKGRGAAKRIVRAHVTRVQHAKSSTLNGMDLQSWTVKPYIHRDVQVRKKPRANGTAEKKATVVKIKKSPSVESSTSSDSSDSSKALVKIPKIADNGAEDPFWSFPVDYKPEIAPIFAHCKCIDLLQVYVD